MDKVWYLADGSKSTTYSVGDKFEVKEYSDFDVLDIGDIVELELDDGSDAPYFNVIKSEAASKDQYIEWEVLIPK